MKKQEEKKLKVETPMPPAPETPVKLRQIIIETNGQDIRLVSADVAGRIELIAILESLANFLKQQK